MYTGNYKIVERKSMRSKPMQRYDNGLEKSIALECQHPKINVYTYTTFFYLKIFPIIYFDHNFILLQFLSMPPRLTITQLHGNYVLLILQIKALGHKGPLVHG